MKKNNIRAKDQINKDMLISDLISSFPQSADVFSSYGLHCIGCSLSGWESIEQGAQVHGMNKKDISRLIADLNTSILDSDEDISEDKNPIKVTKRAVKQVAKLMKGSNGAKYLRIAIMDTPYGQRYGFKFEKRKKKTDVIFEKSKSLFVIDKKQSAILSGSTMDYLKFLPGNGFKIYPPSF